MKVTITIIRLGQGVCPLTEEGIRTLLVIGLDVVSLADSARRAGYRVYAVDYFGDQDLRRVCRESRSIVTQRTGQTCGRLGKDFDPKVLLQLTKDLLKRHTIDAALLSSGLEDSPDVLFELNDLVPVLGSPLDVVEKVRGKIEFFQELRRIGIPYPETATAENLEEARKKSKDIGYPVVVKPSRGFGGVGIRKARNPQELEQAFRDAFLLDEKVLIQEHISGKPASTSMISSTKEAVTLTLNEQLLGVRGLGQGEPFGYCGNVVPLLTDKTVENRCKSIAGKIALHFRLAGSNGIDLVISKEGTPCVIEVNPRFQGTLECVERVLGMNVVEAHVEACAQGTIPMLKKKPSVFCVRLILFAQKRSVAPDLSVFEEVRDIPVPGVIVEEGEPICSIVMEGANRDSLLRRARRKANLIHKLLKPIY